MYFIRSLPRINPCTANQIQIRIFINDGYQVLFCIPAVTKDDDMIFAVKFRHNLPDHGGCQFQFRLFYIPALISPEFRLILSRKYGIIYDQNLVDQINQSHSLPLPQLLCISFLQNAIFFIRIIMLSYISNFYQHQVPKQISPQIIDFGVEISRAKCSMYSKFCF